MEVWPRNDQAEFLCDHCGTNKPIKFRLSVAGLMRRFRAF